MVILDTNASFTKDKQWSTTIVFSSPLLPTLTMAILAHWTVYNNPTGGMVYVHTRGGYIKACELKLTLEYFISYLINRWSKYHQLLQSAKCSLKKAPNSPIRLHQVMNS